MTPSSMPTIGLIGSVPCRSTRTLEKLGLEVRVVAPEAVYLTLNSNGAGVTVHVRTEDVETLSDLLREAVRVAKGTEPAPQGPPMEGP